MLWYGMVWYVYTHTRMHAYMHTYMHVMKLYTAQQSQPATEEQDRTGQDMTGKTWAKNKVMSVWEQKKNGGRSASPKGIHSGLVLGN